MQRRGRNERLGRQWIVATTGLAALLGAAPTVAAGSGVAAAAGAGAGAGAQVGVAAAVQAGPWGGPAAAQEDPAARRAAIEARLAILTDEALDRLARHEFPMPGDPEPTPEDRAHARTVQMALLSRMGLLAAVPDDEPRRVMAEAFVRLSPDQAAVFDADMERFDAETRPPYIRELRRIRRMLDDVAVASIHLELEGAPPMSAPDLADAARRGHRIVTQLGLRHAEQRAARITRHAELLVPEQLEAFTLVAEAVLQEHLQRLSRWGLVGADFDPVHELARLLQERAGTASDEAFAPMRRRLSAALPSRRAAIVAALSAVERRSAASAAFTALLRAGEPVPADHPARQRRERANDRAVDAVVRLVDINESLVDVIESSLGGELGRAYRRRFHAATTPWLNEIWPQEWEDVRLAVAEAASASASAELPRTILETTEAGDARVNAAMVDLREAFAQWRVQRWRAGGYHPADLPALHQRFADQYLVTQRAIEASLGAVHAVVAVAARDAPGAAGGADGGSTLVSLRDVVAARLAIAVAARRQAEELAEAGHVPWNRRIIGAFRSELADWSRAR